MRRLRSAIEAVLSLKASSVVYAALGVALSVQAAAIRWLWESVARSSPGLAAADSIVVYYPTLAAAWACLFVVALRAVVWIDTSGLEPGVEA